jgi:hypothetical protein
VDVAERRRSYLLPIFLKWLPVQIVIHSTPHAFSVLIHPALSSELAGTRRSKWLGRIDTSS